jgi:hypothetical protein
MPHRGKEHDNAALCRKTRAIQLLPKASPQPLADGRQAGEIDGLLLQHRQCEQLLFPGHEAAQGADPALVTIAEPGEEGAAVGGEHIRR